MSAPGRPLAAPPHGPPAPAVHGLHHVTAIAGDAQRNVDFHAGVLGLRLVKRTVNFDDPLTYHLYYGDDVGTPGSLLTFFPWPGAQRGRPGPGQVAVTALAVPPAALGFWLERLLRHGVAYEQPVARTFGGVAERVVAFRDPDGLLLEIVAHPGAAARPGRRDAAGIPEDVAIRGAHAVTIWVEEDGPTARVLEATLGFRAVGEHAGVRRFESGAGGSGTYVDLRAIGGFPQGAEGAGTVHHVAFRAADDATELALRDRVVAAGLHPTAQVDRRYFRSVYFREPAGVLFELATDAPGFAVDEPVDRLGEALQLPPQHAARRAELEAALPPIHLPAPPGAASLLSASELPEAVGGALGFVHRFERPAASGRAGATTLLLLHGTGGDEDDLLPLGRRLLPGAAMLSPRGQVLEGAMPRFFRRHAEGVLDQEDLRARTHELAEFVDRAAAEYGFRRDGVIAVGFSNGADIAASLLLRHGAAVRAAVLLSPMLPFEPERLPDLTGAAVFIGAGRTDPLVPPAQAERLAAVLRDAGAEVTVHWHPGGHGIVAGAVEAARDWTTRVAGLATAADR